MVAGNPPPARRHSAPGCVWSARAGPGPDRLFLAPPASALCGTALQALRELGIDFSDRNNAANERNGMSATAGALPPPSPQALAAGRQSLP